MTAEATARELRERYPGWHIWRGVAGLWYARLLKHSPPVVLSDRSIEGLGEQLAALH